MSGVSNDDRISELPEVLITYIISLLPTIEDKLRTAEISTKWRHQWKAVPKLHFDNGFGTHPEISKSAFIKRTNRILTLILLRGSAVKDFAVRCEYRDEYRSDFDEWTRFAARSEVQKFELVCGSEYLKYVLPQHVYANSSFIELQLQCCDFVIGGTVSWNSLKKLRISEGGFSMEALEKIVAGAPALEFLHLHLRYGISRLHFGNALKKLILHISTWPWDERGGEAAFEILAPSLESLQVSGLFRTCKLGGMPCLVEAELFGNRMADTGSPNLTREVVSGLSNVQTLTIGAWIIKGIAMWPTNDGHPLLPKCKCLTLDTHLWKEDPSAIASLLKSCPEVETLTVSMFKFETRCEFHRDDPSGHGNADIDQYWASQETGANYLTCLRTVRFFGFWEYHTVALPFLQFLLKNVGGLQNVIIDFKRKGNDIKFTREELSETAARIFSFPKSSPDAEITILPRRLRSVLNALELLDDRIHVSFEL